VQNLHRGDHSNPEWRMRSPQIWRAPDDLLSSAAVPGKRGL
jgi:hypothetical protein